MAKKFFHVRFRLGDLLRAVGVKLGSGSSPSPSEALTYYWGWASSRGWSIYSAHSQFIPSTSLLTVSDDSQVEIASDEWWNVIWSAEDATDGDPDLVASMGRGCQRAVLFAELESRGWQIDEDLGKLVRDGLGLPIDSVMVSSVANASIEELADHLESEAGPLWK